jgi:DNA-binding transcriptional ArsR family regulator
MTNWECDIMRSRGAPSLIPKRKKDLRKLVKCCPGIKVTELVQKTKIPRSTVRKLLGIMRDAGVLTEERKGCVGHWYDGPKSLESTDEIDMVTGWPPTAIGISQSCNGYGEPQ